MRVLTENQARKGFSLSEQKDEIDELKKDNSKLKRTIRSNLKIYLID